jgi:large subunit ribosomal protein L19|tara:strand:- start:1279 stop:1761 length:483 start_codon:yes stop_codon:yes gene_type:complete
MKSEIINDFNQRELEKIKSVRGFDIPDFKPGDTISVKYKIVEDTSTRIQAFKGVVIATSKSKSNYLATFTVRKISSSIGVERRFPLYSPLITSIEILKRAEVRRAKLYFLRGLTGKASRLKEKLVFDISSKNTNKSRDASENITTQTPDPVDASNKPESS